MPTLQQFPTCARLMNGGLTVAVTGPEAISRRRSAVTPARALKPASNWLKHVNRRARPRLMQMLNILPVVVVCDNRISTTHSFALKAARLRPLSSLFVQYMTIIKIKPSGKE
jgi:hypothetical protein